ncbi:hypothetical protein [Pleionea mediterranea]|uniref:D-alanine transfer protein n=1 Tax=Pleionea mediterranea TaxID=523701 RepID=A0A316FZG8_9GAMM|nr:hypothetical protein [Pleionea mediterranea]PWK53959.1 hypothetical protein C8D97_102351 [Pleionea mediterranea]
MTSSISNSRKVYLKVWLLVVLGMAVAMSLVRLFTFAMGASGEEFIGRVVGSLKYLPKITQQQDDQVMVFGSSMVEAGFSPRQFDREMKQRGIDVTSYNFGSGGLNPLFQDYYSRRIRDIYQANNKRLKLAIIEFNPFQTTKRRYQGAVASIDGYLGMLASDEELWQLAKEDPTRGALIYNIHYFRDDISAEMITYFFGRGLQAERPKPDADPDTEEQVALRRKLGDQLSEQFEKDYPDYVDEDWSYNWQGGGTIPAERSEETLKVFEQYYESLRTPYRMASDKLWREISADITELRFQEELVESFIKIVKNFKQFSDQVEVIMLPKNSRWIKNSSEALARQQAVIERIEKATGIKIIDYQNTDRITPEMFIDTTHLTRYHGGVVFTNMLVEEFADDLKASDKKTVP